MIQYYNNEAYEELITEFFGDLFYLPGQSYGTKIQKIRQYTEIVVRRLLHYRCDKNLEIGNDRTLESLDRGGFVEPLFRDALEKIRSTGNERTHTKYRHVADEAEYNEILDSLLNIYGYLFYKFFKKYSFGSNQAILSGFSLLPPIIRHIALDALFQEDQGNVDIIEKLTLAKAKAFNQSTALEWIEDHKEAFQAIDKPVSQEFRQQLVSTFGEETAVSILATMSANMYEFCLDRIKGVAPILKRGPLYTDFESAKAYYQEFGIVKGSTPDVTEFNDLMEFIYIGRRVNEREIADIPEEEYLIVGISPLLFGQGEM